jgi:hypothetical protein
MLYIVHVMVLGIKMWHNKPKGFKPVVKAHGYWNGLKGNFNVTYLKLE